MARDRSLFLTRPNLNHHILTREELLKRAGEVLGWIQKGQLKLRVGATFPLADAAEAHRFHTIKTTSDPPSWGARLCKDHRTEVTGSIASRRIYSRSTVACGGKRERHIHGDQVPDVVGEERPPGLGRRGLPLRE